MKEKSLESRRVRTQPCTNIGVTGTVWFNASLTEVGDSIAEGGRSDGHTQALARRLSTVVAPKLEGMIFPRIPHLALRVRPPTLIPKTPATCVLLSRSLPLGETHAQAAVGAQEWVMGED